MILEKCSARHSAQPMTWLKEKQVEDTVTFLSPQAKALLDHDSHIDKLLRSVERLDTSGAQVFKNQLLAIR